MLLSGQEFSVVQPDFGHRMHVDKCPFVQVIDHFEIVRLGKEVELLDVKSGLFQVVEPKFVAAWEVQDSTLVQASSFLEVF